jgi:predicted enzyme related to lactoylglutathione lyase
MVTEMTFRRNHTGLQGIRQAWRGNGGSAAVQYAHCKQEARMAAKLTYVIEFVADMDRAVKFYKDMLGLAVKFQSPGWSEFATGEVTFALHPASEKNPAGKIEMGFRVPDIQQFHTELTGKGVRFSMPPTKQDFGGTLAQFIDSEGAHVSVGG